MNPEILEQQLNAELDWLTSRRWFGDKARPVVGLRVLVADQVGVSDSELILSLVQLTHEWGDPTIYFVPILAGDGAVGERDATAHKQVLRWMVDGFAEDRRVEGEGIWTWRRIGGELPATSDLMDDSIRLITAEQSNSSIIFGDAAIGKLFRRVQAGVNPDLEIGEHLMLIGTFEHAPALFGVVELEFEGERFDIAALQEFVPNVGDGWSWLLQALESDGPNHELVEQIALLGTRTGELHLALAMDDGDEQFTPESIGEDEAQAIIRRIIGEMEGSVEGLTHHLPPHEIERLHKALGAMMGDAWSMVGTSLIRVHGDYHLGQTLRTQSGDFAIIDFEGEPSRTMDERRQKLPALKDVAGMLRSLDYAGATMMQRTESDEERAEIAAWVKSASDAYVSSWRTAIAGNQHMLVPENEEAFQSVLNLMIAEKALYELRYEMNNRPDWLWIPLDALLRLVSTEETE